MIDKERDFKDGIEPDYRQGENNLVRHFNPVYQQMDKSILSFWGVDEKEWEDEMESYLRSHEEKICVLIKNKEIEVDIYKLQKECIDFLVHFVVSTTDRKKLGGIYSKLNQICCSNPENKEKITKIKMGWKKEDKNEWASKWLWKLSLDQLQDLMSYCVS